MTNRTYTIAVIPGDGIGQEVVPEGLRVIEAAAARFGFALQFEHHDFASCDYYRQHGQMMPDDWRERLRAVMPSSSARWAGPTPCPITSRSGDRC